MSNTPTTITTAIDLQPMDVARLTPTGAWMRVLATSTYDVLFQGRTYDRTCIELVSLAYEGYPGNRYAWMLDQDALVEVRCDLVPTVLHPHHVPASVTA